jgi:hypothetical protein
VVFFGVVGRTKQRETHWFTFTCEICSLVEVGLGCVVVKK